MAYHLHNLDDSEPPLLPDIEFAETRRPSVSLPSSPKLLPVAKTTLTANGYLDVTWSDSEDDNDETNDGSPHPKGSISHYHYNTLGVGIGSGRRFGIKDLENEDKIRPPFDGFMFELDDASEDSLSEDEDDIFGELGLSEGNKDRSKRSSTMAVADESVNEFNREFGLDDLEDESKVQAPFSDFAFEL